MKPMTEARPIPPRAPPRIGVQLQTTIRDRIAAGTDTIRALAAALPHSTTTITRAVEQLERDGLIERCGDLLACRAGAPDPQPAQRTAPPGRPGRAPTAAVDERIQAAIAAEPAAPISRHAVLASVTTARVRDAVQRLGLRPQWAEPASAPPASSERVSSTGAPLRRPEPASAPANPRGDRARPAPAAPEAPTSGPSSPPVRRPGEGARPDGARAGASPATEDLEPAPGPVEVATGPEPIPPAPSAPVSRPPPPASPAAAGQARTPPPVAIAAEGAEADGLASTSPPPSPDEPVPATAAGDVLEPSQPGPVGAQRAAPERAEPAPAAAARAPAPTGAGEVARGWSTLSLPSQRARVEQGAPPGPPPAPAQLDAADELAVLRATLADALDQQGSDAWLVASVRELREERDVAREERIELLEQLSTERSWRVALERAIAAGLPADLRRDLAGESAEVQLGALIGLARGGW